MANRYTYQFNGSLKPRMTQLEGFVSVGTGGTLNYPPAYPIFPVGTGPTGIAGQTGLPLFQCPGQPTAGVPTGWLGGFSGCIGLIGAGVNGVQRVATGLYAIGLSDDWVSLDSIQISTFLGATGCTGIDVEVMEHTVGLGNSVATGGYTLPLYNVMNPKNMIYLQFNNGAGVPCDVPGGGGFFLDIRVRDSLAGVH